MLPEKSFFSLRGKDIFGIEMKRAIEAIIVPAEENYLSQIHTLVSLVSYKSKMATRNEKNMTNETIVELKHPNGSRDALMQEMKIVCIPRGFVVEPLSDWRDPI